MEYLDVYDEEGNYLGQAPRDVVHKDALWHNTVHCWLYDEKGNVYFQIRKDEGKLYTTASGHVKAAESLNDGFAREIKEEIGLDVDPNKITLVGIVPFIKDLQKADGTMFRDRAKANVYVANFKGNISDFIFDPNEVLGVVKVNAKDALKVLTDGIGTIKGVVIKTVDGKNIEEEKDISYDDFLFFDGETPLTKYGFILEKIIVLTKSNN